MQREKTVVVQLQIAILLRIDKRNMSEKFAKGCDKMRV